MTIGKNIPTFNALCVVFIVLTLGIAAFDRFVPKPNPLQAQRVLQKKVEETTIKKNQAFRDLDAAKLQLADRAWASQMEQVSPQLLKVVTDLSMKQKVSLKSFRPQKPVDNGPLSQAAYLMNVEATFPQIMAYTRALEAALPKAAISQVVISSSDAASDQVSAAITIAAFIEPAPKSEGARG